MKIIHTADWHLGQTFYGHERYREHKVFLDWLCNIISEKEIDLLLIAGDVFDSPNPSAEAQRMFYTFLTKVTTANEGLQVIVTAGNHDSAARLEAPMPMFDVFNTSMSGVVHFVNDEIEYERMIVPLKNDGCCLAVPYLRMHDLPEADSYSEGVALLYNELYKRAKERGYSPIVAMGHLQASGAEVSVGDDMEYAIIGGMEGINAKFANEGIAYTALGHLHRAQRVGGRENIRYSGAPLPMSFAERNNKQSVTMVVLDSGECDIEKIVFDAPIKLLSVPATFEPIEVLVKELTELPDGELNESSPYLEVKVLVKGEDASLRQQIEDAVEGKAVRLTRIVTSTVAAQYEQQGATMTYDEFKRKDPVEIMQEIYKKKCKGEEMPVHLLDKLNKVIKEVRNEDIGNKGV